nr:Asp-tRNA(Asn)/Glu-tRNA(Gln) amidotransferase GatCAB subunit B [Candidatus Sigynarchaeota archaeon]
MGDISRRLNEDNIDLNETKLVPKALVQMLDLIENGTITGKIGKTLIKDMLSGTMPSDLVNKKDVRRIGDESLLAKVIDEVIVENEKAVADARTGTNPRSFEFLVGQVMKKTRGQADPEITRALIKDRLA